MSDLRSIDSVDAAADTGGSARRAPKSSTKHPEPNVPVTLSDRRTTLERRTRDWKLSAGYAEQSLRQLMAAQDARVTAIVQLQATANEVERRNRSLTDAITTFDEPDADKDLGPLFGASDAALEALELAIQDLRAAQSWCSVVWNTYREALEAEQLHRMYIDPESLQT